MSLPQPILDIESPEQARSRSQRRPHRRQRSSHTARFRAAGWEMTGRLTVNLALTLVALSALVRLIPYYQTQRQVLRDVETSVETATAQNQRLKADFSRYFDPTQASQLIRENGARESDEHIPIVWVDPLSSPADSDSGQGQ